MQSLFTTWRIASDNVAHVSKSIWFIAGVVAQVIYHQSHTTFWLQRYCHLGPVYPIIFLISRHPTNPHRVDSVIQYTRNLHNISNRPGYSIVRFLCPKYDDGFSDIKRAFYDMSYLNLNSKHCGESQEFRCIYKRHELYHCSHQFPCIDHLTCFVNFLHSLAQHFILSMTWLTYEGRR